MADNRGLHLAKPVHKQHKHADLDEMEEADTFIDLLDKRQEFEGKVKSFEDSRKEIDTAIKTMLDNLGVKKCTVGPYKISYTTVERKPQPERVVPAKPGSTYQKLTVSLNKEKLQWVQIT